MPFEQPLSSIDIAKAKLMTAESYAELSHETPYIFELEKGAKKLTYFGSPHTNGPESSIFMDIEDRYLAADPDIVFVEGFPDMEQRGKEYQKWATALSREDAIRLGESTFTLWLAVKDKKEVKSPEPRWEDEIAHLEKSGFTRREIFVFYIARQLNSYQSSSEERLAIREYVTTYLNDGLIKAAHWRNFDFSFENFLASYEQIFGEKFDIEKIDLGPIVDPIPWPEAPVHTRINETAQASTRFRDLQIIQGIGEALQSHDKLFVTYGASHAVMQEPAMRSLFS